MVWCQAGLQPSQDSVMTSVSDIWHGITSHSELGAERIFLVPCQGGWENYRHGLVLLSICHTFVVSTHFQTKCSRDWSQISCYIHNGTPQVAWTFGHVPLNLSHFSGLWHQWVIRFWGLGVLSFSEGLVLVSWIWFNMVKLYYIYQNGSSCSALVRVWCLFLSSLVQNQIW